MEPKDIKEEIEKAMDTLEKLKNKPHSPEYLAMMEAHRKEWAEIAEEAGPWEWAYGLNALVEHIKWMRDYYLMNENVWGMEKKDEDPKHYKNVPTRLETLEKALYYYDRWINLEDEYIKVEHYGEMQSHDNGDGTSTIDDLGFRCVYKYGSMKRTYKKLCKAQRKYKKLFYKILYKYMEEWWD